MLSLLDDDPALDCILCARCLPPFGSGPSCPAAPASLLAEMRTTATLAARSDGIMSACTTANDTSSGRLWCAPGGPNDRSLPASIPERRVDQRVHHPAHDRLGFAVARAADVFQHNHRLDSVDDRERLHQAIPGARRELRAKRRKRDPQDLLALATAEGLLLQHSGGFKR